MLLCVSSLLDCIISVCLFMVRYSFKLIFNDSKYIGMFAVFFQFFSVEVFKDVVVVGKSK